MRTTAANVAARAAVGGDDMLSKWQLMAEQARQKREGGMDSASGSQAGKDAVRKSSSASGRHGKDNQEGDRKGNKTLFGMSYTASDVCHSKLDNIILLGCQNQTCSCSPQEQKE